MEKYLSLTHFSTFLILEKEYKKLMVFFDDFKTQRKHTKQFEASKNNCVKTLEIIIENKKVLNIDFLTDQDLLNEIKYDIQRNKSNTEQRK